MKIAISAGGNDLDAPFESRFGRAPKFIIVDLETNESRVIDNTRNLNAVQGAGIQTAQNIINSGAKAVITGHCGPKAFRVLATADVKVYTASARTVREAVELYRTGKLDAATTSDVEGHWA